MWMKTQKIKYFIFQFHINQCVTDYICIVQYNNFSSVSKYLAGIHMIEKTIEHVSGVELH